MRSVLYVYQVPDFSMIPCSTPASRIVPDFEMPSP